MGDGNKKLPEGWVTIKMDELMVKTPSVNPANRPANKYELWSVPAFPTDAPEYVQGEDVGSNKQIVQPGDVLLCKINPRINRVWLVREKTDYDQIASTEWIVLRCNELLPEFIMYLLREEGFRHRLCADLSGIGGSLTRARPRIVGKLEIDLSPLNEQKRIVAKIEELQARSQRTREALETIPDLLEQLRQSILAAAFRGDLTKEWRKRNARDVEPASELLKRIRLERRKRWEAAELEKLKAKGLTGDKLDEAFAKQRKKYKEPARVDTSDLPELPEGWCWVSWDELASLITSGSRGWANYYAEDGPIFIRAQDINTDKLDLERVAHVKLPKKTEGQRTRVIKADLLITITGANVTKAALVQIDILDAYVSQHVALVRAVDDRVSSLMHLWAISVSGGRGILIDVAYGGGKPGLNLDNLKNVPMPLPPVEEIRNIISTVNGYLNLSSIVTKKTRNACEELDTLDQTILSKAFCGELVSQEPEDQPASVLLERIPGEKEREVVKRKPREIQKRKILNP